MVHGTFDQIYNSQSGAVYRIQRRRGVLISWFLIGIIVVIVLVVLVAIFMRLRKRDIERINAD